MTVRILQGDCSDVLPTLQSESIDSIVTDPPYGLKFMGKKWDHDVPGVNVWAECLRVLKPGGHLLAFSGSRTYHRMVCNIEDAGFEIRDQIMWIYGSGFPKSLDVSKAIDKRRSEDFGPIRVVCRFVRAAMDTKGLKSRDLATIFECHPRLIDHWAARDTDSQPALPTWDQWLRLKSALGLGDDMDTEVWRLNGRKGQPGAAWLEANVVGKHEGTPGGFGDNRFSVADNSIREPSHIAKAWDGWGTALKPAHEPIVVARKPLIGTVAENVLKHGTGALNIDGCRIPADGRPLRVGDYKATANNVYEGRQDGSLMGGSKAVGETDLGRWPANIIHDGSDEVLQAFPQAPGQQRAVGPEHGTKPSVNVYGDVGARPFTPPREDAGSAARFFYCAKAAKKDRGADNPHPTVKPTELMRYLCRLVTPPGGVVLDPFMGSGSTGKAASIEGFDFVGIEIEAEYVEIARVRIHGDAPLFAEVSV